MGFGVEGLSTSLLLAVIHMLLLLGEVCRDGFSLSRVFCVFSIDGSLTTLLWLVFVGLPLGVEGLFKVERERERTLIQIWLGLV